MIDWGSNWEKKKGLHGVFIWGLWNSKWLIWELQILSAPSLSVFCEKKHERSSCLIQPSFSLFLHNFPSLFCPVVPISLFPSPKRFVPFYTLFFSLTISSTHGPHLMKTQNLNRRTWLCGQCSKTTNESSIQFQSNLRDHQPYFSSFVPLHVFEFQISKHQLLSSNYTPSTT